MYNMLRLRFSVTDLPERMNSVFRAAIDVALLWQRHSRHLVEAAF